MTTWLDVTRPTDTVVGENVINLGQTLTVVCQYDRSLFEHGPEEDFVQMATRRFERVLRNAITEENN